MSHILPYYFLENRLSEYNLIKYNQKENYGAFSISSAIRGPYDRNINPWYRNLHNCEYCECEYCQKKIGIF
jgi:hypothetical protein